MPEVVMACPICLNLDYLKFNYKEYDGRGYNISEPYETKCCHHKKFIARFVPSGENETR